MRTRGNMLHFTEPPNEICLLSPAESLSEIARRVAREMEQEVGIYTIDWTKAPEYAADLIEKGAKVIICRKGTKDLVERTLGIPVIGIESTVNDYMKVLLALTGKEKRVAFIDYGTPVEFIRTVCPLVGLRDISFYSYTDSHAIKDFVRTAAKDGAELIVGGSYACRLAAEMGLDHFVVPESDESVHSAFVAAHKMLQAKKVEIVKYELYKFQMEQYKTVLNKSQNSIIVTDEALTITFINIQAEKIFGKANNFSVGNSLRAIRDFDKLFDAKSRMRIPNNRILQIRGDVYTVSETPIRIDAEVKGYIFSLENAKNIKETEYKIRLLGHEKGNKAKHTFADILCRSSRKKMVIETAKKYARTSSTVLLSGETGTGKELFAQSMHNYSERRFGPFVAINCAALSKNLLESELFGYEDGAFTGALKGGKAGVFEMAHGGTIFLDEIGEIPEEIQVQLLRVLQEKEVRRLGSGKVVPVDVRVISATNKDLAAEVNVAAFRRDLFYRLCVLRLTIPPLRELPEDIEALAHHFLFQLDDSAFESARPAFDRIFASLSDHDWPGNIRELQNVVERIHILLHDDLPNIDPELLVDNVTRSQSAVAIDLGLLQRNKLLETLEKNNFSKAKTAENLGISRTTLWRKMKAIKTLDARKSR